jgi:HSP20 family protein
VTTTPARYRDTRAPARREDPVAEMEQLQAQMGQIINSFFRDPVLGAGTDQAPVWVPAGDIEETDDAYIVELEVPGVRKEDVNIELRDNEVRISGEIKEKERTGVLRRRNRRAGQFQYLVTLPSDIDPDKVNASLHDGVLTVRLGKSAASKPRQIQVRED